MSTSSVCNVPNIIKESFKGYIEPEDLYTLLKHLFPNVEKKEDFQLDVRLFPHNSIRYNPRSDN
jgi:hypothetical protein